MGEFNTIFLLCYSQMQVVAGCYVHCNNLLSLFGQPSLLQNSSINSSKVIYCPAAWISVLRWLGNFSIEASASLLAEFEKYLIVQFLDSGFKVSIVAGLFLSIKHRSLGKQTQTAKQCSSHWSSFLQYWTGFTRHICEELCKNKLQYLRKLGYKKS